MADVLPDRSLAGLFGELTRETAQLFRQEIDLAKAELAEKARQAGWGAAELITGGLVLFVAFQALVAAAILGLATVIALWAAAAVVGLALAVIGAAVLARGLAAMRGENLTLRRTFETFRDNTRWAKEQLR
ncbi:phage holin family protein [Magnetospirillum sp. UT-4]|uniref:phage holin family protein n=1 Tax=Magnetospirillum sp. UT-4 TaxID=2681467 RepID=UPI001381FA79|nr:phage holin family protein [Magnetospirillum sp. UT-4]CAA7619423.1 conserved hypothetical protein [Magnetospirillum sp. UT-4]